MKLAEADRLIKPGRALFSVVGLKRTLGPAVLSITKAEFAEAAKLEPTLYGAVFEFLDEKRDFEPAPPVDIEEITHLLTRQIAPENATDNLRQFNGHPGGEDLGAIVTAAKLYLTGKLPQRLRTVKGFGGPLPTAITKAEMLKLRDRKSVV
jgi:hypothetical protein